jgi:hypothetical protein
MSKCRRLFFLPALATRMLAQRPVGFQDYYRYNNQLSKVRLLR